MRLRGGRVCGSWEVQCKSDLCRWQSAAESAESCALEAIGVVWIKSGGGNVMAARGNRRAGAAVRHAVEGDETWSLVRSGCWRLASGVWRLASGVRRAARCFRGKTVD
jgi:hypothetical protein